MTMEAIENLFENVFYGCAVLVVVFVGGGFLHLYNDISIVF